MAVSSDPYYEVRDRIHQALALVTSTSNQYQNARAKIDALQPIEVDINDLAKTIDIVEANRQRFASISDIELNTRKRFVNESRSKLHAIRLQAEKQQQVQVHQPSQRVDGAHPSQAMSSRSTIVKPNQTFASTQQQTYAEIEGEQDVVLEDISTVLDRLKDMNQDIGTELKVSEGLTSDIDSHMDDAQSRMTAMLKKIDKILASSDRGRLFCIVVLFLIVILLLFIIVSCVSCICFIVSRHKINFAVFIFFGRFICSEQVNHTGLSSLLHYIIKRIRVY